MANTVKWTRKELEALEDDLRGGLSFSDVVKNSGKSEMSCRMAIYRYTLGIRELRREGGHDLVIR